MVYSRDGRGSLFFLRSRAGQEQRSAGGAGAGQNSTNKHGSTLFSRLVTKEFCKWWFFKNMYLFTGSCVRFALLVSCGFEHFYRAGRGIRARMVFYRAGQLVFHVGQSGYLWFVHEQWHHQSQFTNDVLVCCLRACQGVEMCVQCWTKSLPTAQTPKYFSQIVRF